MTRQQSAPDLYKSTQHRCPYLLDQTAANLLVDPRFDVTPALYDSLIDNGFRRNGTLYYRPHCPQCDQCRSVRIPAQDFKVNRSQQRAMKRNASVTTELRTARFTEEHFSLYRRYQSKRHTGDSMDDPDPEKLIEAVCPDILVKGADWPEDQIIGGDFVKQHGGRIERVAFEQDISTTRIIERIGDLYYGN